MSPTTAYAVLWTDGIGARRMIDVDIEGDAGHAIAQQLAVDLAETGRRHVEIVGTDLAAVEVDEWTKARARLVGARVLREAMFIVREAVA